MSKKAKIISSLEDFNLDTELIELGGNGISGNGFSGNGFSGNGFSGNGFAGNGFSGNGYHANGFSFNDNAELNIDIESLLNEQEEEKEKAK